MHETALMERMLHMAAEQLAAYQVKQVNTVTMKVGRLANVLPEALKFAFSAMTHEGLLAGAELILIQAPYAVRCRDCDTVYESRDLPPLCPACGRHGVVLLHGDEVYLESIDFEQR